MAKSLFNEAAMYVGRKSKRASGTVIAVTSADPGKIVLTHLKIGIILATTVDRDEVSEILFRDVDSITISSEDGYADGKHMQIRMKNGTNHLFAFKKDKKAQAAVQQLNQLMQAAIPG